MLRSVVGTDALIVILLDVAGIVIAFSLIMIRRERKKICVWSVAVNIGIIDLLGLWGMYLMRPVIALVLVRMRI